MKHVKRNRKKEDDELRPEYDLKSLRVRKLGPDRTSFGETVIETRVDREHSSGDNSEDTSNESDLC
jgi:hypothetical protein